jgi:branched-subunit amino acid transport protein
VTPPVVPVWLWPAILSIAAGTYLFRVAFLQGLAGRGVPEPVARALRLVPAAALSALIVSSIAASLVATGAGASPFGSARVWAAAIALVVALRRRNMFLTILTGMAALWILQRFLP